MSRELVHLGQRVCKMETWEIKLEGLFGVALGKGLCYRAREFGWSPAGAQERRQCWDSAGAVMHRVGSVENPKD